MVQTQKKIALLHRYPEHQIRETNAAFPYLRALGIDVLTFKKFDRLNPAKKFLKSLAWVFYAPLLVFGKGYDVIYCDDSFPFYAALVKIFSPKSKVILRLGDFHLMYYTSGWLYILLHFFEKISWRIVDGIIPISEEMQRVVQKVTGRKTDEFIRDPVDLEHFSPRPGKHHGTVMFHGLLVKNKNVDVLLDAARKLPRTNFVVIGDGPDRKRLEGLAPHNVFFKGWVPYSQIPRYIATCSVGVSLRSDNPGNDYVVTSPFLQYGAMGKPCLVSARKVFGLYRWQFVGPDSLAMLIIDALRCPETHGRQLRDYVRWNHDAKNIAERIWSRLQS